MNMSKKWQSYFQKLLFTTNICDYKQRLNCQQICAERISYAKVDYAGESFEMEWRQLVNIVWVN